MTTTEPESLDCCPWPQEAYLFSGTADTALTPITTVDSPHIAARLSSLLGC
ncbi:hypothetical protein OIE69_02590 [Actinacidiphila glaucinigra]|uniref:hypothetical protein n=1 Tax=Actinacidiphila glaucinigra TaxID=235986 RepID=UPI002DD99F2F|nr:hypothetical protein [Actinacidiphila glaucinigra]WSD57870.1 hypothetical protein OIE69_02590 [Actinacidiphila glaucinigra]